MNIRSLSFKNTLIDDNGEEYFDLSVPSFDINSISIIDIHLVTREEEGRLDKICEKYYSTTEYIDTLCLINHLFNPFSIKEGDLIVIPSMSNASQLYYTPEIPGWLIGETNTTKNNKTNTKDNNRITRLKQQNIPRKPNELKDGQTIKKYVNGKIILGTHLNTANG